MHSVDLKDQRDRLWCSLADAANAVPFAVDTFTATLENLYYVDRFWTWPGYGVLLRLSHYLQHQQYTLATQLVNNCVTQMRDGRYRLQNFRPFRTNLEDLDRPLLQEDNPLDITPIASRKPYFEVLVVHPFPDEYEMLYRQQLAAFKSAHDEFLYDIVFVASAEDALSAVLANIDIQAVVYLNHVVAGTTASAWLFGQYARALLATTPAVDWHDSVEMNLCRSIRCLRPGLDHYLISELPATELPFGVRGQFTRVLFHVNPFHDLHAAILNGLRNRYSTPFFDALQAYGRQPKGVFHALPLSRGASVKDSPWIHDMLDFYGRNIFLAETSSTQGGLDSLLDPSGAIKQAHAKAAETFGADASYFVTNGTSTSNKIVMQANLRPGDIVLVSADCHKSIPYAVMLAGAFPIFLETYAIAEHDLYGGVSIEQVKAVMRDLQKHGRLDRLKQITLTNSTFDGLVYHAERFMLEILAIKPDVIFHWDEAWSASAHFHPLYYSRTAMSAVQKIRRLFVSPEYLATWNSPLPELRVYVTQSTHKTLSSFRQGSMIHVADTRFDPARFIESFRMHTSTSPNYQIIASLDIARRQAAIEGYALVRESIRLALQLRARIRESELLKPYFDVLCEESLVPAKHRDLYAEAQATAQMQTGELAGELPQLAARWGHSEFVIDPTHVTVNIRRTGLDGSSFRQLLMTRYAIQVNKTSRHTVLFLINIGATQSTIDYLLQVLRDMAAMFGQERRRRIGNDEHTDAVLPEHRQFHPAFLPFGDGDFPASDMRAAYFEGTDDSGVDYAPLSSETLQAVEDGRVLVSATFVTPYPPGFPVLMPGQVITADVLRFFQRIRIKEIHGFSFERGFRVFRDERLAGLLARGKNT